MFISLLCFCSAFLIEGIFAAGVMLYFEDLSEKRRTRTISNGERWQQGTISIFVIPILEAVLSKDPMGVRILVTVCLVIAALLTLALAPNVVILILSVILGSGIWLSMPSR